MIDHGGSLCLKDWGRPFETRPFGTEWDQWCEHRLSAIDQRFGAMPVMRPRCPTHWWDWDPGLVHRTMRDHAVVHLQHGALDQHIQRLFAACRHVGEPRIVISDTQIPHPPPDNVRVIVAEQLAYQFSRTFAEARARPTHHRRVADLRHPFMIMARGSDHGRARLMLVLEQLGLLADALYSVGDIDAREHLFGEDPVGVNAAMTDMATRMLGGEYIKFDVGRNMGVIPALIDLCHFYVGVDGNGLYRERMLQSVSEKNLWGYTTTCPVLPIWHDSTAHQMRQWGYRFTNVPHRLAGETLQATVIRWCREILFLCQITQNPGWGQSWQDSQGEITAHNFELTRRLHRIIWEGVERQIQELPAEFQNL